ncbi:MAG: 50S ribosomal protein L25, partial [Nocardioidaceae bacterium]|nr:50S ribosomal protein L25 [Nocardioidaceae bacterium]
GTQIHASDLVLPEGSTLLSDPEALIVNVTQAQEQQLGEVAEGEAAEGAAADEAPATDAEADSE